MPRQAGAGTAGWNAAENALLKCFSGRTSPRIRSQSGGFSAGTKTSDTKAIGRIRPLATAGALLPLGASAASARPSPAKAAVPTMKETIAAGIFAAAIPTSKKSTPTRNMIRVPRRAIQTDEATVPARKVEGGRGVPLTRFKSPNWRWKASVMPTLARAALAAVKAARPGV